MLIKKHMENNGVSDVCLAWLELTQQWSPAWANLLQSTKLHHASVGD